MSVFDQTIYFMIVKSAFPLHNKPEYRKFGNVLKNLILANICEFIVLRKLSTPPRIQELLNNSEIENLRN